MSELALTMLIPGGGAVAIYLVARVSPRRNALLASLTAGLLAWSVAVTCGIQGQMAVAPVEWHSGSGAAIFRADALSLLMVMVAQGLGLLVAVYSGRYLALDHRYEDYYPLLLLLVAGVTGMALAVDLFTLYMLTVLTSAATFVLVSFRRRSDTSVEAGFKYTMMGTMASILILAGVAFVFRSSGSLALPLAVAPSDRLGLTGVGLILTGYAVKGGIAPGHTWLPDAHGRAPSSISAMLSGVIVQSNILALVKVGLGIGLVPARLGWVLVAMGLLSMSVGNLMGLRQRFGKRLLAYSTVAQSGYLLTALGLGLATGHIELLAAGIYLIVAHAVMKSLAFLCKGILHFYYDATTLDELEGLARLAPLVSMGLAVALGGLAGIAPLAGFTAKVLLLGGASPGLDGLVLAVLMVVLANTLLAFGYYLPFLARPWRGETRWPRLATSPWMLAPVIVLTLLTVWMGVMPAMLYARSLAAAQALLAWGR